MAERDGKSVERDFQHEVALMQLLGDKGIGAASAMYHELATTNPKPKESQHQELMSIIALVLMNRENISLIDERLEQLFAACPQGTVERCQLCLDISGLYRYAGDTETADQYIMLANDCVGKLPEDNPAMRDTIRYITSRPHS